MLWLRASALGLLILFLMEPVLTRKTTERVLPLVAVVVDQSGSMAVKDESMAPGNLRKIVGIRGMARIVAGKVRSGRSRADAAA